MSLLDMIRAGGELATLFHRAVKQQQQASRRILEATPLKELTQQLTDDAHTRLDEGTEQSALTVLRQCEAGCSACCHSVTVDVTPLEAFVVVEYLQENVPAKQLEKIITRLRENNRRRAETPLRQRQQMRQRCSFLDDQGTCSVYEARPLVCAGVFSLSSEACNAAAQHVEIDQQEVPLDRPAKSWTMGVSGGLQRALVEAGLDGNLYELGSAVLCVLETPNAVQRWLDREDVFRDCHCTDPHSPPRKPDRIIRIDPPSKSKPKMTKKQRKKAKQRRRAS